MKSRCLIFLAALFAVALAPAQLAPSPPPPYDSLDTAVISSWLVIVGKAVDGQNGIFIEIEDTLKGEKLPRVKLTLRAYGPTIDGHRLLVFASSDRTSFIDLSDPTSIAFNSDLKLMRDPEEIVRYARGVADRTRGEFDVRTFAIALPTALIVGTPLMQGYHVWGETIQVKVPVGARLLTWAKEAIRSKNVVRRADGARALGLVKSEETMALGRGLLSDPGWIPETRFDENRATRRKFYPVRKAALDDFFIFWGERADRPVIYDPPREPGPVVGLDLSYHLANDTQFAEVPTLPELEDLNANAVEFSDANIDAIAQSKSLETLMLAGSNIDDAKLKRLAVLPRLFYLNLENTSVTDKGLLALADFKALKRVDVGQKVTRKGIDALRKKRPDLQIREDEFAFLAPLKIRRVEIMGMTTRRYKAYNQPAYRDFAGLYSYALIVSQKDLPELIKVLHIELPKRGWTARALQPRQKDDYARPNLSPVPWVPGYTPDQVEVQPEWPDLGLKPEEAFIAITRNPILRPRTAEDGF